MTNSSNNSDTWRVSMSEHVDPRTPCLIGWNQHTWARTTGSAPAHEGAPEPLAMWEQVSRAAAAACGATSDVLAQIESAQVLYCQSWPYDDPVGRLATRLDMDPGHRVYSGIGGTTSHVLVQDAAKAILAGDMDLALVASGEALHTKRQMKKRGERPEWSHRDPEKQPFPFESPFLPAEVAHEVFQAWFTFAMFDNARRAHLGIDLDDHRQDLGDLWHGFSTVAAENPNAWFPIERSADEIVTVTDANRMVGYPYTKFMVSVMDVDMAAALIVASHEKADALGVPAEQRVYLRGWSYATDPVAVAAHPEMWRSPAMAAASSEALGRAGVGIDDVAHLDLYSCFASSVDFARDALRIAPDDDRPLTVTGGLPYFGGPGSGYMTHSIATMAETLRDDPGSTGMVSGVGMHMTKHVFGVYSTTPGPVMPPDDVTVQARLDAVDEPTIVDTVEGHGTVIAYSIAHNAAGPDFGVLIADVAGGRAYARVTGPALMADAETSELVGRSVELTTDGTSNVAVW